MRPTPIAPLLLGLALASCGESPAPAPAETAATPAPPPPLSIDEGKLSPMNRFAKTDLDTSKAACDDFGAHVNGTWLANNPVPADRTSWGAFSMLDERSMGVQRQLAEQVSLRKNLKGPEKIVADFWGTGMDEAKAEQQGMEPLRARLAEIDALTDGPSVAAWLRSAFARGDDFVFHLGPWPDFKDSTVNIAYVEQGGLGLPDREYYSSDDADKKTKREAYKGHVAKVLELSGVPAADTATQAEGVLAFETRLAKVSKSSEELARDVSLYYRLVNTPDADKETPNFSWTEFFTAQGIAPPASFSLPFPDFQKEVNSMLADTPVESWKTYLRFHTVDGAAPYLSSAFAQQNFEFYGKAMRGQKEIKPRWKRVLDTIEEHARDPMGQLYVQVAFPPESKAKMVELVANLREALKVHIEGLPWMSAETKAKAMEKWASFTPKIGYPDQWRDWSALQTTGGSFVENVWAAQKFDHDWKMGKVGKPVDRSEWGMGPQTVNAYYDPQRNEIVFPAAILQSPFFDAKADDPLNYGGIGAVIGHELTHGYDDQGSRFGASGNFENWWTDADAKGFAALTGRLVEQYNGYSVGPDLKVNGNLTLGENIADLGGIAIALDAMKKAAGTSPDPMVEGQSREQRFFFGWATVWRGDVTPEQLRVQLATDPHSPARVRVIGPPSNMQTFADAFQCPAGSPMARADKVVIW